MRTLSCLVTLAASAALATPAHGQAAIVIKAARLFDARSGRLETPGLVVVEGTKISAVGARATPPAGAQVIDLGDATLLPGLMDAHVHVAFEMGGDWRKDRLDGLERTPAEKGIRSTDVALRTLRAGFTTVRNLGSPDLVDVALRNAIADGKAVGPRILAATDALGSTGGHCDGHNGFPPGLFAEDRDAGVADSPHEFRGLVRTNIRNGADVIKVCATGGVLSKNADVESPQLTQAELDAIVDEAHARKRKVTAHAHGNEGARRAIVAGVDSIEHGSFLDEATLDLMKKRGTWLVPTLMAAEGVRELAEKGLLQPESVPKFRAAYDRRRKTIARAIAKGLKIAFGTDAGVFQHGRNAEEFRQLVALGMTPVNVLKAATVGDAELFGVADRLGTLEAGKIADVVAVPGDPLKDIRQMERVLFVMKDGVVHRNDRAQAR